MANKVYFGNNRNALSSTFPRAESLIQSPLVSAAIRVATAGTYNAVNVPPKAIVHSIGMLNVGTAVTTATLSVGITGVIGKFITKVSALPQYNMVESGLAGTVAGAIVPGYYFATGGTIKVGVATGTNSSVRILVWYVGGGTE